MKENAFRVLGAELDETESYIDLVVDGIDEDVNITFADVNDSTRTWTLKSGEVQRLLRENYMIGDSEVVKHDLWKDCLDLGPRHDTVTAEFVPEKLREAQRALFLAAYYETR